MASNYGQKMAQHRRFSLVALLALLLVVGQSAFAYNCNSLTSDPRVAKMSEFLQRDEKVKSPWGPYLVANFPVLLINSQISSTCVALFQNGQADTFEVANAIALQENPVYSWINPWRLDNTPDLSSVSPILKQRNILHGILLDVGQRDYVTGLSAKTLENGQPNPYYDVFGGPDKFFMYLLAHESVHASVQENVINGVSWPENVTGMGRDGTIKCYSNDPQVSALASQEKTAMLNMVKRSLMEHKAITKLDPDFQAFVAAREKRYSIVGQMSFDPNSTDGTCVNSEAVWEWVEGGPDYYSFTTLVRLGYLSYADVVNYDQRISSQDEQFDFYFFGASILEILSVQNTGALNSLILSINNKTFPASLYEFFKKQIQ